MRRNSSAGLDDQRQPLLAERRGRACRVTASLVGGARRPLLAASIDGPDRRQRPAHLTRSVFCANLRRPGRPRCCMPATTVMRERNVDEAP